MNDSTFGASGLCSTALEGDDAGAVLVAGQGKGGELWGRLTVAEHDVVTQALEGRSNVEIATRRRRAIRTVANQLATVYARFGVRGRCELAALLGPAPAAVA